jgi:hypothetical protein
MPKKAPSASRPSAPRLQRPARAIQRIGPRPLYAYRVVFAAIRRGVLAQLPLAHGRLPTDREAERRIARDSAPVLSFQLGDKRAQVSDFINWSDTLVVTLRAVRATDTGYIEFPSVLHFAPRDEAHLRTILPSIVSVIVAALRKEDGDTIYSLEETIGVIRSASQPQLRAWADELCALTCQAGCRYATRNCTGEHSVVVFADAHPDITVGVALCGSCALANDFGMPVTHINIPRDGDMRLPAIEVSMNALIERVRGASA